MRATLIFPLLVVSLLTPALVNANDLARIYDTARKNDAQLDVARYTRDAAMTAEPKAFGAFLPKASASLSGGRTHQNSDHVDSALSTFDSSANFTNTGIGVSLTQTLFNWQTIELYRQAQWQTGLAESTYHAAEQNLILRVASAYFGVLATTDTVRSNSAEAKALKEQLDQAQARFQHGAATITDVQDAQARYDVTLAAGIVAQQALDSAREALGDITGNPQEQVNGLRDDFPLRAPEPAEPEAWVVAARENNFDLLAARFNNEIAKHQVSIAKARYYPTLNLAGSYQTGRQADSLGLVDQTNGAIGLQLSVPIFDGFVTSAFINEAEASLAQSKAQIELTRRQVEHKTRDAFKGVFSGAEHVKALRQALTSTTTSIDASKTGLKVGTRTAVDVLNAEQLYYSAQRDFYKSHYDYLLSLLTLKASAGSLTESDLDEIDKLIVNQ